MILNDERQAIIRDDRCYPRFLVRAGSVPHAWIQRDGKGLPGFATFVVYEVHHWDEPDIWIERAGEGREGTFTRDLDEAVETSEGDVMWDGCANLVIDESKSLGFNCALHVCDADALGSPLRGGADRLSTRS